MSFSSFFNVHRNVGKCTNSYNMMNYFIVFCLQYSQTNMGALDVNPSLFNFSHSLHHMVSQKVNEWIMTLHQPVFLTSATSSDSQADLLNESRPGRLVPALTRERVRSLTHLYLRARP